MRKNNLKLKIMAVILILITIIPLAPRIINAWSSEITYPDYLNTTPKYSTHQWLSWKAIEMFPDAQISWITENLYAFWHGVEAPLNGYIGTLYGHTSNDYGDIDSLVLYLDENGTNVTNDSLAIRACEEYERLITELSIETDDYFQAAFYAGTMSHYIAQAGLWAALWNESLWNPLSLDNWTQFENAIEYGNKVSVFTLPKFNFRFNDMTKYGNNYFNLTPTKIAPIDGYNATINLAKNVHPYAKDLGDNFNASYLYANQWPTSYKTNVSICLTYSVEAIYAALKYAMNEVNWRYISIPTPIFNYDNSSNHLTIPEFNVTYFDENGFYNLNESLATKAEVYYIYYNELNIPASISTNKLNLDYNDTTDKWFLTYAQGYGLAARTKHSLLYKFDMNRTSPTWSNITASTFYVNFINVSFLSCNYYYSSTYRTLSVYNITANCSDIPEVGLIDPIDVTGAKWFLYQKGVGCTQTGEFIGVPMIDVEGTVIKGNLSYNYGNNTWESKYNDIGLVFTPSGVELYVIVRFNLTVPVGYIRKIFGFPSQFKPFLQYTGTNVFKTRDHNVIISKPQIVFNKETHTLSVYNITAYSDYKNTFLDYNEIVEKGVYGIDRRNHRWKIFLYDGIGSSLSGELLWNDSIGAKYWYAEEISVSSLTDNIYYIAVKITNQNMNSTTTQWGPPSDYFYVSSGKQSLLTYLVPLAFITGLIVIPLIIISILVKIRKKSK